MALFTRHAPKHVGEAEHPETLLSPAELIDRKFNETEVIPDEAAPEAPKPTFTPAPTTPMKALPGPDAPGRCRPVRLDMPLGIFGQVTADGYRVPSPVWCSACGTDYADETTAAYDRMLLLTYGAANAAGWGRDRDGSVRCPACLSPKRLPVLAGGMEAEVALMISMRTVRGDYEDLAATTARRKRREQRRRHAVDAAFGSASHTRGAA